MGDAHKGLKPPPFPLNRNLPNTADGYATNWETSTYGIAGDASQRHTASSVNEITWILKLAGVRPAAPRRNLRSLSSY